MLVFEYLYRDASNYKALGSISLSDQMTDSECDSLLDCLEDGEFFVAERVGVPPLYSHLFAFGGRTCDDHAWHTFVTFRTECDDANDVQDRYDTTTILAAFREAKDNWQPHLSSNFD